MSESMGTSGEVTSDDKLWALLAYVFSPIAPIVILVMQDKKSRPFIRAHNAQALAVGVIVAILGTVLSWTVCLPFVFWGILVYWGVQAYQGKTVNIPVVSDFVKNQGWA